MPMATDKLQTALDLIRDRAGTPDDSRMLAALAGEPRGPAFAELLRRHGPMVFGVCWRMLGNDADARDAFQDTFLRFVRRAGSIREARLLAGWLYRVAANECRRI